MLEVLVIYIAPEGWNKKFPETSKTFKKETITYIKYSILRLCKKTTPLHCPRYIIILIEHRKWDNIVINVYAWLIVVLSIL